MISRRQALGLLACAHGVWAHALLGSTPLLFNLLFWSSGLALLNRRIPERVGLLLGATAALYGLLGAAPSTHNAAYLWTFLACFVVRQLAPIAFRAVAITIYLFAALNKAISRAWLSGDILSASLNFPQFDLTPFAFELAVLTIVAELGLVILLIARYRNAWFLMLLLHLGILASVSVNVRTFWALVNYGLLMVWLGISSRAETEARQVARTQLGDAAPDGSAPTRPSPDAHQ